MSKSNKQQNWGEKFNYDLDVLKNASRETREWIRLQIVRKVRQAVPCGPIHPTAYIAALDAVRAPCGKCIPQYPGLFFKVLENGKPKNPGPCYWCQGTGHVTLKDAYRTRKALELAWARSC